MGPLANFWAIVSVPDNIPIVFMLLLVGFFTYLSSEEPVHVEAAAPDRRRIVGEEIDGAGAALAALRMEAHLGEEGEEQPLEPFDAEPAHPRHRTLAIAREVLRRGRRHGLPAPDEEDQQKPYRRRHHRDDQDAHAFPSSPPEGRASSRP